MRIERVHFQAFGTFVDRTFYFKPGLNLILAPNESGKSTLLKGIYALLYGSAQEGLRVRREADWYMTYRPWLSDLYGGEIDYTLDDVSYCLVRNLQKGREGLQLFNRVTGEELQDKYLLDQRKERNIAEKQLGLSGELYRRIAYVTSVIPSGHMNQKQEQIWQQKLLGKLSGLLVQGEETELTAIVHQLDTRMDQIGRTEQAKNKPLGILSGKLTHIKNSIDQEQNQRDQGLQDQVELQKLLHEQAKLEDEYKLIVIQQQRLTTLLQLEAEMFHYEAQKQEYEKWEELYMEQQANMKRMSELELRKADLEPVYRMQFDDVEELRELHSQNQNLAPQMSILQKRHIKGSWWGFSILLLLTIGFCFVSPLFAGIIGIASMLYGLWYVQNLQHLRLNQTQCANREMEKAKIEARLAWWKENVGTDDVGTICTWWKQTQAVEQIEREQEKLFSTTECVNEEEGQYLRNQLETCRVDLSLRFQGYYCSLVERGLDVNQLEQQREKIQNSIREVNQQIGEKMKQVEDLDKRTTRLKELWVEWEIVNSEKFKLLQEKEAIQIAKDAFLASAKKWNADVLPHLHEQASKWVKQITNLRYQKIYSEPTENNQISAHIPETGRKESIDQLSTGTIMQMIFAMKMSIVEYITAQVSTKLPILLDDCFTYYDDDRLYNLLPMLAELSKTHQILLCTCHNREQKMLQGLKINAHSINLTCS